MKIKIPKNGSDEVVDCNFDKNAVIVGANGAGKTRLGSHIERINHTISVKRISAQRYLNFSDNVPKQDFQTATQAVNSAYKNQSPTAPQADYQQVLIALFAEQDKRNEDYTNIMKDSEVRLNVPKSAIEKVVDVWNFIFPYRKIRLSGNKLSAEDDASSNFSAAEMSDGERVGFYLISQIVLASKDSLIIIDEPELHLHKSLMIRLWNKLELTRSDCSFVYITHDLDFAVSKCKNKLIWVENYKNNKWNWIELDSNKTIPENLYLELLGSRKPVLFVEGNKDSIDSKLYQLYYENYTIIPCGSCEKVIRAVKEFRKHVSLHHKQIYGLIDKDFRSAAELSTLKSEGVYSFDFSEIESLLSCSEVLEVVCGHLQKTDAIPKIKKTITSKYNEQKDLLCFEHNKQMARTLIVCEFDKIKSNQDYNDYKTNIFSRIDEIMCRQAAEQNADELLKKHPYKGLISDISSELGLKGQGYADLILRLLASDTSARTQLLNAISSHLPSITE